MMMILPTFVFGLFFGFFEYFGISKRLSRSIAVLPLTLLFSMVAFNRMNDDYLNYEYAFIYNTYQSFEFGYGFLMKTVKGLGFNYNAIVFLIGCLLTFTLLKVNKKNKHTNIMLILYCCFPLIYDLNQIRNLMMYLIIILSLGAIENGKQLKYYIGVIIAFSIHKLGLIYFPLYFLFKKNRKSFMKILSILFFTLLVASPIVVKLFDHIFPFKMGAYLANVPKRGVIIPFALVGIDVFTVWWIDKKIASKLDEKEKNRMEVLYRFVWFSILSLPFSFYFLEIIRIQRNALLVKYIYCTLAMSYLNKKDKFIALLLLIFSVTLQLLLTNYEGNLVLFNYLDSNPITTFIKNHL